MEKGTRGFGTLKARGDVDKVRRIASMGGKAAVNRHRFTHEEAVKYGQIGGKLGKRPKKTQSKQ